MTKEYQPTASLKRMKIFEKILTTKQAWANTNIYFYSWLSAIQNQSCRSTQVNVNMKEFLHLSFVVAHDLGCHIALNY